MTTVAILVLVAWAALSVVAYIEGLKPRGSAGYKALDFLAEVGILTLAVWTLVR